MKFDRILNFLAVIMSYKIHLFLLENQKTAIYYYISNSGMVIIFASRIKQ